MSYLDESEYDDHGRDDRRGRGRQRARDPYESDALNADERRRRDELDLPDDRGPRRPTQPARPAWDAATYGTPDDVRVSRPPAGGGDHRRETPSTYDQGTLDPQPARSWEPPVWEPPAWDPPAWDPPAWEPAPGAGSTGFPAAPDSYRPPSYGSPEESSYGEPSAYPEPEPEPYRARRRRGEPDPAADAPYPAAPNGGHPGGGYPGDSYPGDSYPGDSYPGDSYPGDSYPGDSYPGGGYPGDGYPGGVDDPAEDPATAPRQPRAGRNLPAAIGVGLGLGGLAAASLFMWRPAFLGVIAVVVGIGSWELVRAIRVSGANPPLIPLVVGATLMTGLAWWGQADALTFGLMVTVLAAMVWRLADGAAGYLRDVTSATLVAVYLPFLAGFAVLLANPPDGDLRVIVTLAGVVLSDTGGYIAGVMFGRHPMAPSVSPKKSWEGLAGSLVATGLGEAILLPLAFDARWYWGLVFGLAVSGAAVIGDLGESMIKRDLGVKDMSNLLPGHGGFMDRLDSILLAAPTAYVLLTVIAPVS